MKDKFLNSIDKNETISRILRFLHIRDNREENEKSRRIFLNKKRPKSYINPDEPLSYCTNAIITSRYTLLNFLPKNLFEQFRRVANFYFLINAIIIFILPDPPTSPVTSILPLLFVIIVTGVKQLYEDILRHKADREINNSPIRILRDGHFNDFLWKDIVCGDIIEVAADQPFPCDLLLLYSQTEDNKCYITTANLDGETNLKPKEAPSGLPEFNIEDVNNLEAVIEYEKPNANLYEFAGKLIINNQEHPIANDNILLRGCCLRVSPKIVGCAVYTGKDTKMMKNSKFKSNKMSCIERKLNQFIAFFLCALAVLTFLCFGLSFTSNSFYVTMSQNITQGKHWYLQGREPTFFESDYSLYNFCVLMLYMFLFNYIVPISMYVTIEVQRFVGSTFIEMDMCMYDKATDQPAKANTSDLNEDLGQVEYLFSDKTGTLTENIMEFKQFSIDGVKYEEMNGVICVLNTKKQVNLSQKIEIFLEILSLCHSVQKDENGAYQASSPDEFCFINFCKKIGIVYEGDVRENKTKRLIRTINYFNKKKQYELLDTFEFDSTRKRMSVILKDLETNKIMIYCKGAETFIIKKCVKGDFQTCLADIDSFAEQGWRTLAFSMKIISETEYKKIKDSINSAYNDVLNRGSKLAQAFEDTESGLTLIGATAIEDKLQEDVADTLETLRQSGIKIWVLTGDKKETAINISHSCKHFSNEMEKLVITDLKEKDQIGKLLNEFKITVTLGNIYALIIDGPTLFNVFNYGLEKDFRDICMQCVAVLCCRMSPAQKAEVVKLVKRSEKKPMTAAIGDGANDVSMIQEAHVGLGIFGKEGRNAARSADFAFAKFKMAKRILLVHGFLYYTRASILVQYFFYKNLTFMICQFYYAFFNAFSVTSLYDSIVLTFYNITLTSAPIFLFGLFEQKVSIDKIEKNPYLYRTIALNKNLTFPQFLKWNFLAFWHSVTAFFFGYAMFATGAPFAIDGKLSGSVQLGAFTITLVWVIVHVKLLIEWNYKTYFLLIGYSLSILGYILMCLVPNSFIIPSFLSTFTDYQSLYWTYYNLLSNASVWFCLLLSIITAHLPDFILKVSENLKDTERIRKIRLGELETVKLNTINTNLTFINSNNSILNTNRETKSLESDTPVRLFVLPSDNSNTNTGTSSTSSATKRVSKTIVINSDITRF